MKYTTENTIRDLSLEFIKLSQERMKESKFELGSLSQEDQDLLYQNFYNSYMKSVGSAWDRYDFDAKGKQWTFFGNVNGGIALRHQNSGMWKMNACYGNLRDILKGIQEMQSQIGNDPIWGGMTDELCTMLEKATKRDGDKKFKRAPMAFAKIIAPYIIKVFGGDVQANSDGSLSAKTPGGKSLTKYLIANKRYYLTMIDNAENHADKMPVPQVVIKPILAILKVFVKMW